MGYGGLSTGGWMVEVEGRWEEEGKEVGGRRRSNIKGWGNGRNSKRGRRRVTIGQILEEGRDQSC